MKLKDISYFKVSSNRNIDCILMQLKVNKLVELNVAQQVSHLANTSIVQNAWKERELTIHGWVYDLGSGKLKDLDCDLKSADQLPTFA